MFNKIDKFFFIGSFLIHLIFITLILCFNLTNSINKKFVVYGAHSKKPTNAYFKPSRQTNKSNWSNHNNNKHSETKKLTQNKQSPSVKNLSNNKKHPIKKLSEKSVKRTIKTKNKTFKNNNSKQKSPASTEKSKKQTKGKKIRNETKPTEKNKTQKIEPTKKTEEKQKKSKEIKAQKELKTDPKNPEEATEIPKAPNSEEPEELNFDLIGEQDPKLTAYQKLIQKGVDLLWHPPIGVPKGTECTLCFTLDSNGNVASYEVLKKSDILIYDLSVFRIAKSFKFDKSLWNKKFTIRFKQ